MRSILNLAVLVTLVGASSACVTGDQAGSTAHEVTLTCPGTQPVKVTFTGDSARLVSAGTDVTLAQRPAGSGIWYEGGGHMLRGKGSAVTWTDAAGTARECTDQSATATGSVSAISGTSWQLAYFRPADEATGREIPARPESYTVEFMPDGTAAFRVDCNRLTSQWTSTKDGSISFSPGAMTRAFCGPEAWDTRIARDLGSVRSFEVVGDTLSLTLEGEGGTYAWTRLAAQ